MCVPSFLCCVVLIFEDERPVRLWMIGEGEEEDLEVALMKCPVPQKKVDGSVSL